MAAVIVEELRDPSALTALEPEWWELWHRSTTATPFQAPAWLIPWSRHFGGDRLFVLTLRRDRRLVGILPLFRLEEPPASRLLPCGAGISDYLDGVFADEPCAAAEILLGHVRERQDVLDLFGLRPGSPLLHAPPPEGWTEVHVRGSPCLVLALPTVLPKSMQRNLRYCRRRAEKHGTLQFKRADLGAAPAFLEALFRLHGARWADRGEAGVLADRTVRRFHREAAPVLAGAGLLRLYALLLDDRPVAIYYGFAAKGHAYYYLSGFEPDLATLGLGTLIVGHAIEEATLEGAATFDFLGGQEAYKYRWGARDRPTFGRLLRRQVQYDEVQP
ncbi:MAG TPA: GNAT family N-acetyltransferase [Alphaproteobacteria bacterium]|nr:GNAT family N-acetyltransferase [Alphaproteobacteria bacterium]